MIRRVLTLSHVAVTIAVMIVAIGLWKTGEHRGVSKATCSVKAELVLTADRAEAIAVKHAVDSPGASGEMKTLSDTVRAEAAQLKACR